MATEKSPQVPEDLLCVEMNADKRGGVPVLRGTRFTVAQLFAELADGRSIVELAADFELEIEPIRELLQELANYFDRPAIR